jgi:hypothetical protein
MISYHLSSKVSKLKNADNFLSIETRDMKIDASHHDEFNQLWFILLQSIDDVAP